MSERCLFCDKKLKQPKQGRERLYCDANCRQKSHQRKKDREPQPEDSAENRLKTAFKRIRELEGENTKLKADLIFCQTQGKEGQKTWMDKEMDDFRDKIASMQVDCIMAGHPTLKDGVCQLPVAYSDHPMCADKTTPLIEEKQNDIDQMKVEVILESLPKTLMELKELCPPELKGFDRSTWISKNRRKYGI